MEKFNITYSNYDVVFKDACSIFNDKVLDFLGIDLPKIERFMETDIAEIETKERLMDLNFLLENGQILHLEEEVSLSEDDLIRFASYDLKLYSKYRRQIRTIVLCIHPSKSERRFFTTGQLSYEINIVDMSKRNADEIIISLREKIKNREGINELELIFLPLMSSSRSKYELLKEAIGLEKELNYPTGFKEKIMAMTIVLMDKIIEKKYLEQVWEEIRMLKILEFAEEKGMEKGRKDELEVITTRLMTKKFGILPENIREKIKKSDIYMLETVVENILELASIQDAEKYFI